MKNIYILIGLPGVGKTTWWMNYSNRENDYYLSTDDIIGSIATKYGFTYSECFKELYPFAEKVMNERLEEAASLQNVDVYIDRTNMSRKSRAKFIEFGKKHGFIIHAVEFKTPDEQEHKRRLNRPGKVIPDYVIENMKKSYEEPTLEEGFDGITYGINGVD